jgi:secreted PhoX family phosphatase
MNNFDIYYDADINTNPTYTTSITYNVVEDYVYDSNGKKYYYKMDDEYNRFNYKYITEDEFNALKNNIDTIEKPKIKNIFDMIEIC